MSIHPIIAVGLDGVIFEHVVWKAPQLFGKVIPKAREGLMLLRKAGFKILIWTYRLNYAAHSTQPSISLIRVKEALDQNEIPYDEIFVGPAKPDALFYLDDRGVRFEDWEQALKEIMVLWEAHQDAWTNKASRTKNIPNKR